VKRHTKQLNVTHPHLAAQWHPTKNGDLRPDMVTAGSKKKPWWRCAQGHEWEAIITNRSRGIGCGFCSGKWVIPGANDLATVHPQLAAEWHPVRNGELTPSQVRPGSDVKAWWHAACGHEWEATVTNRRRGTACPSCAIDIRVPSTHIKLADFPQLTAEWDAEANGGRAITEFRPGSKFYAGWRCARGHRWHARIHHRTNVRGAAAAGCPRCSGRYATPGENDLASQAPEVAATWHPTKNGELRPQDVPVRSNAVRWFMCKLGHEWETQVYQRTVFGTSCPTCYGRLVEKGFNDLATLRPDLAAEWHPTKNGALSPSDVGLSPATEVWWLAACGHEWFMGVARRTSVERDCPRCALVQQSKMEKAYYDHLQADLAQIEHGARVPAAWGRRKFSSVDILGRCTGRDVVIEYDGCYWHAEKLDMDTEKTVALLAAGYVVVRIREQRPAYSMILTPFHPRLPHPGRSPHRPPTSNRCLTRKPTRHCPKSLTRLTYPPMEYAL
jgi:very-short-patch-repair endonuclease